ncbi:MAG: QueT transporter family protein [Clostridia bacterium]|nr:QueT transporter family protein [Clostridia bacterium]
MKNTSKLTRYLTRASVIAALYTVLTLLSAVFGLSSGVIQLRLSEALCLLPILMPEATVGLFVGCLISNLVTGCALWDVIFGSLATLVAALITRHIADMRLPLIIKTLPTILANAIVVPFVLIYAYGAVGSYILFFVTVALGEIASAGVFGTVLFTYVSRSSALRRYLGAKK